MVKKYFNEKAIIFVQDFSSLEACADYIIQVDTTPELYNQYKSQNEKMAVYYKLREKLVYGGILVSILGSIYYLYDK